MVSSACPSRDDLIAYLEEDLPDHKRIPIEAHLAEACPACEDLLTTLENRYQPYVELLQRYPRSLLKENSGLENAGDTSGHQTENQPEGLPVGKYRVLQELGRGGMGIVYKAQQIEAKRVVALKMILSGQYITTEERSRFHTEATTIAGLDHPHIVRLYEVDIHNGTPFFVMEFVDGESLAQRLKGQAMAPPVAASLVEKLARAIHYAHTCGVVHRDLKPANVLLGLDGEPKITDFGIAKQMGKDVGQTQTGALIGTPAYMAPEQAEGRTQDIGPQTDVYALGVLLYVCLTNQLPFTAGTVIEILDQVRKQEPLSPRHHRPEVARDLETICLKCLEKQPAKRYASASELAEDLRRFQAGEPIAARPVSAFERLCKWAHRQPLVAALTALVIGVVLIGFCAVIWQWQKARDAEVLAKRQKSKAETNA
jgi:serine/threonine protein kinase